MNVLKSVITILVILFLASGCGGGGGNDGENSDGNGSSGSGDFVRLSIDSSAENTYTEAFSAAIVCEPRVDWASNQVILYDNYIGAGQWDMIFDIMFISDAVGTYDITAQADAIQAVFMNGSVNYIANFVTVGSSGTVNVTRSDTRIEGTFTITAVDADSNPITLSGSFGVDSGNSLNCS
jgi:hypothetical protein